MPLMYLNYTEGSFSPESLGLVVNKLTRDAIQLEKLQPTDFVTSTTWIYSQEYPKANVFHGGNNSGSSFIALEINVIQGGYSASTKRELIQRTTDAIGKHGNLPEGEPRRVYVIIREVAESNWGFDGQQIDLENAPRPARR